MEGNDKRNRLFSKLENYSDDQERLNWKGSFEEYIDMVVDNPGIARTSYKTAYDAVTSRPDFFTTGENALYGAGESTNRFIDILKAGSEGLEIGKRIILLLGPPGSGKSTLVKGTKKGIENFTKTEEGAIYAIDDCPMNEEPLHLIPEDLRPGLEEEYGIHIEGNLCPYCEEKYSGSKVDPAKIKKAMVKRIVFSEKNRIGIGTFKPSDPKSQDITELVGSIDYSKIGEYGTGSDPRAYRFDGELNVANRGIMEFVEMLKSDEKFLYSLLDLTQDRVIKAPRFAPISADEVILAHTNLAEYNRYVNDPRNEALRDRMVVIPVPYTLEVSQERKIHEKLIAQSERVQKSGIHINPLSIDTAATFGVLSRLAPSAKYTKRQKLKIYDGKSVENLSWRDAKEMHDESPKEGMTGISPRYIIDSLSLALTNKAGENQCLTPIDTYRALRDNLDTHPHTRDMKPEEKASLIDDLTATKDIFDENAKKEVQKAFMYSYEDTAKSLCDNYLNNIEAYCTGSRMRNPFSDKEVEPDEALMRGIEEHIKISDSGKKEFRTELLTRMGSALRRGQKFDYTTHPRLKEAIEQKLFADMKDMVKLTTGTAVPNDNQQKRISEVEKNLIEDNGYCEHCAREMIHYVGTLLNS